jgi:hypothetical protein
MGDMLNPSLLPSCSGLAVRMWLPLNRYRKRLFLLFLALILGIITFTVLCWDTINESI